MKKRIRGDVYRYGHQGDVLFFVVVDTESVLVLVESETGLPAEVSISDSLFYVSIYERDLRALQKVGSVRLSDDVPEHMTYSQVDLFAPDSCRLYTYGETRPCTAGEAASYEPLAVWTLTQVQERATDQLAGRRSKWLDSLRH